AEREEQLRVILRRVERDLHLRPLNLEVELSSPRVDLVVARGGRHVDLVEGDVGVEVSLEDEIRVLREVGEAVERHLLVLGERRVRVFLEEDVLLSAELLELAHLVPPNGVSFPSTPSRSGAISARKRSSFRSRSRARPRTCSSAFRRPISWTESGRCSGDRPA